MSESAVSIPALSAHVGISGSILTSHMGNGQVPKYELGSIFEGGVSQLGWVWGGEAEGEGAWGSKGTGGSEGTGDVTEEQEMKN